MEELSEDQIRHLHTGEVLLFGYQADNVSRAEVIGPSFMSGGAGVRLLEDFDTGVSFFRAGSVVTARVGSGRLWWPTG